MVLQRIIRIVLVLVALGLMVGCGDDKEKAAAHQKKAEQYFGKKDYVKARIEAQHAVQLDESDVKSHLILAQIDEILGDNAHAIHHYQRAIKLEPTNIKPKLKVLSFLVQMYPGSKDAKMLERIESMAADILTMDKDNVLGLTAKAAVSLHRGKEDDALKAIDVALKKESTNITAITVKVSILFQQRNIDAALELVKGALKAKPDSSPLADLLVQIYLKNREPEKAIRALKELADKDPGNKAWANNLINLYVGAKNKEEAKRVFESLLSAHKTDASLKGKYVLFLDSHFGKESAFAQLEKYIAQDSKSHLFLVQKANLLVRHREIDKGIAIFQNLVRTYGEKPEGLAARNQIATVYLAQGKAKEADEQVIKVLEKDPQDATALLIKGHIALNRGEPQTAIANYQSVLALKPNAINTMKNLAVAYGMNNNKDLAKSTMEDVVKAVPDDVQAIAMLAQLYMADKENDKARKHFENLLQVTPNHLPALRAIFEIQVQSKELTAALETAKKISGFFPKLGVGDHFQGLVEQEQGNHDNAIKHFENTLQQQPNAYDPIAAMARSYIKLGQIDLAIERVNQFIAKNPNNTQMITLLGRIYLENKDKAKAEQALKDAVKAKPEAESVHYNLANFHLAFKDTTKAIDVLKTGINSVKVKSGLQFMLASIYQQLKKDSEAEGIYTELLKTHPNEIGIVNNLALLLAEKTSDKKSIERALSLVDKFKATDNPYLLDTLGWVNYKADKLDDAVDNLQRALKLLPADNEIQYHLGMAYYRKKNVVEAKKYLEQAVQGKQPYMGLEEAKATLAKLSK